MKLAVVPTVLFLGFLCCTASGQVFKGHRVGETAQQFFSVATITEHNSLTTQYCKNYLADHKVLKAYEKAKAHPDDARAVLLSTDVDGCRDVQSALDGKDVRVGSRYANELGSGWADFHKSRLVILGFSLKPGTPFEDVVIDIGKELGGVEPEKGMFTRQSSVGSLLQEYTATWRTDNLHIEADEMKDEYGDMGIAVTIADSEYLKEKEANRPSTIR